MFNKSKFDKAFKKFDKDKSGGISKWRLYQTADFEDFYAEGGFFIL